MRTTITGLCAGHVGASQAHRHLLIPFVPELLFPRVITGTNEVFPAEEQPLPATDSPTHQSPGYIPESDPEEDLEEDDEEDPEEDPAHYPADRGDDDDDAEDEHLAPADPAAVAYSADQDPYHVFASRFTFSSTINLSLHYSNHFLRLPYPPLSLPSPPPFALLIVEGGDLWDLRASGIRQSHSGDRTRPPLRRVQPESYELSSTVDEEDEIIYSQLDDARQTFHVPLGHSRMRSLCDQTHSRAIIRDYGHWPQQLKIAELQAADRRRESVITECE
ncbi:hypothetical protein Tco_1394361 [Tanacetum coccineum]